MAKNPLYKKFSAELREEILSGKLQPGEKLPSELKLAEKYQISRITARLALQLLEDQSLVYRRQGSGTFVSAKPTQALPVASSMFSKNIQKFASDFKRVVKQQQWVKPDIEIATALNIPQDSSVLWFRRIDWVKKQQLAFDEGWIFGPYAHLLGSADLENMYFWELWQQKQGFSVTSSTICLEAIEADDFQANLLGLKSGQPILLEESDVFAGESGIARFRSWYRFDMYKYKKTVHFKS